MARTLRWIGDGTGAVRTVKAPVTYTVEVERWSCGEEDWVAEDVVTVPGFRPEDAGNAVADLRGLHFLNYLVNGHKVPKLVHRTVENADYCLTVKQDGMVRLIRFYAVEEPQN